MMSSASLHQVNPESKKSGSGFARGCLIIACVCLSLFGLFMIWLLSGPEGGVRLQGEMEEYATLYNASNQFLRDGEELIAYYDVTVGLDGTEAAFVSNQRVFYLKNGYVSSIESAEITDVKHRVTSMNVEIIEVRGTKGGRLAIEIAPFNRGELFYKMLLEIWPKKVEGDN